MQVHPKRESFSTDASPFHPVTDRALHRYLPVALLPAFCGEILSCLADYSATARCCLGATTFLGDILEHRLIQEQLGPKPFESLALSFELATSAIGIDLSGVMAVAFAMLGSLTDADLGAEVGEAQSPG